MSVVKARTAELKSQGVADPEKAAMEELRSGALKDRLNAWVDPILEHRRAMKIQNAKDDAGHLLGTGNGFEYWQLDDEVYRTQVGNRGPMENGVPGNARWECGIAHYERFKESVLGVVG